MAEKEYIERGALYKDVSSLEVVAYKSDNEDFDNGVKFILEKLDAIPAADVIEARHGKWITKGENGLLICSECGTNRPFDVQGDKIEYWQGNFCNICGAKMDGERKEQK